MTFNEGGVDGLSRALCANDAALAVRFERGFDARFFLGRQPRRFIFEGLDDVAARMELAKLRRNVFAVLTAGRLRSLPAVLLREQPIPAPP